MSDIFNYIIGGLQQCVVKSMYVGETETEALTRLALVATLAEIALVTRITDNQWPGLLFSSSLFVTTHKVNERQTADN